MVNFLFGTFWAAISFGVGAFLLSIEPKIKSRENALYYLAGVFFLIFIFILFMLADSVDTLLT